MGSVRRWKGRWQARYRGPDGKERARSFDRKLDADRWLAGQEVARAKGEWSDPVLGRTTVSDWHARWRPNVTDLAPGTAALYDRHLAHVLEVVGGRRLADLRPSDVQAAIGGGSPTQARHRRVVLNRLLDAAVADGYIARNPARLVQRAREVPQEMHFLTAAQVAEAADAIGEHYRPAVLTAAWLGLRWGELAGLGIEHVDLLRGRVTVVRQLVEVDGRYRHFAPPKTKAGTRAVSVPPTLVGVLEEVVARPVVQASRLMFPAPAGEPMWRANLGATWRRARGRAGLDGVRWHDLRHTAVALAVAAGAHPLTISRRMGHASITVTLDRYGHLFPDLDETLAESLDAGLASSLAAPSPVAPVARLR